MLTNLFEAGRCGGVRAPGTARPAALAHPGVSGIQALRASGGAFAHLAGGGKLGGTRGYCKAGAVVAIAECVAPTELFSFINY